MYGRLLEKQRTWGSRPHLCTLRHILDFSEPRGHFRVASWRIHAGRAQHFCSSALQKASVVIADTCRDALPRWHVSLLRVLQWYPRNWARLWFRTHCRGQQCSKTWNYAIDRGYKWLWRMLFRSSVYACLHYRSQHASTLVESMCLCFDSVRE